MGAGEGEKWAGFASILTMEPTGLGDGWDVKRFMMEREESRMTGQLSA